MNPDRLFSFSYLLPSFSSEPPSLSQITASALDDSNLHIRWTAPVDQSVTGFVLEWFAVRENKSILFWERLNSSCTASVITGKTIHTKN